MPELNSTTLRVGHLDAFQRRTFHSHPCLETRGQTSSGEDRCGDHVQHAGIQPTLTQHECLPIKSEHHVIHGQGGAVAVNNDGAGPHGFAAGQWHGPSMSQSVARGCRSQDLSDVERLRGLPMRGVNDHTKKQRGWLKIIAYIFPCLGRNQASRGCNGPHAHSLSHSSAPASSPSVGYDSSSATSPTTFAGSETNSHGPLHPPSPIQLHPSGLDPVSMPAALAMGSFQGVAQANVHGGTFYAAQTINIIVSPPFHGLSPFDLASGECPAHQPPYTS